MRSKPVFVFFLIHGAPASKNTSISLQTHQTPPFPVKTWPGHTVCCVMGCHSNKVPLLGQDCREERWALAQVIYFTVKGRYMKRICCSICQVYFQLIKDVGGLILDPAWERRVWCRPTPVFLRGTHWESGIGSNLGWHQNESWTCGYYHYHAKTMGTESPHYFAELCELPWLLFFCGYRYLSLSIFVLGTQRDTKIIVSW